MSLSPKTQLLLTTAGLGIILIGLGILISLYWLPKMRLARETILNNEASVEAIQRQQENLSALSKQLTEREAEKKRLDTELWDFSKEDNFFELWDTFGTDVGSKVTLETVADATPGAVPVQRDATLVVTGSLQNILRTIQKLSTMTPALVLHEVRLSPNNATTGPVSAQVLISTLWHEDPPR